MSTTVGTSSHSAAYKPQVSLTVNSQMSSYQKLSNLFQQIDTAGRGRITKAQFEQAFSKLNLPAPVKDLGHEVILGKLDPNGSGVITKPEFIQRMEPLMNLKATSPTKLPSSASETEPPIANPAQSTPSEMSPLDGFALGNIINISV